LIYPIGYIDFPIDIILVIMFSFKTLVNLSYKLQHLNDISVVTSYEVELSLFLTIITAHSTFIFPKSCFLKSNFSFYLLVESLWSKILLSSIKVKFHKNS